MSADVACVRKTLYLSPKPRFCHRWKVRQMPGNIGSVGISVGIRTLSTDSTQLYFYYGARQMLDNPEQW